MLPNPWFQFWREAHRLAALAEERKREAAQGLSKSSDRGKK